MDKEINEKKEFSQRLVQALLDKGFKSKHASSGVAIREMSIATGISMEMARRYTLGLALPKPHIIKIIADWLNVNSLWLRDGIALDAVHHVVQVPLISWQQINNWQPGSLAQKTHQLKTIVPISSKAYAVETITDLSPVLLKGTILIIEPEKQAIHKSLVLVLPQAQSPAELKQLWFENHIAFLNSLDKQNPQPLTPASQIKGVFVSADFAFAP